MDRLHRACVLRALRGQWPGAAGAGLAASLGLSSPAFADDGADMRQELKEMRQQYEAELKRLRHDYDARLSRLETKLRASAKKPATPEVQAASAEPAPGPAIQVALPPAPAASEPATVVGPDIPATPAQAGAFNPAIGVILNGHASTFSKNPDTYRVPGFALGDATKPGVRGFSLDESEVNFSANVDPYFFGNLSLSIAPDNQISVEEGFIQTTGLPAGFTLKAGRFFSGIGYLNEQHSHTWDFADQALPYRVFLNNQYGDDGVQLRWLAPTKQFIELGGEAFRGAAFPASGAGNQGLGAYSVFAHTGGDIGESNSYRAGVSWLHTKAVERDTLVPGGADDIFNGKSDTLILDAVYKWAPNGNPVETNFKLQGELFARHETGSLDALPYSGWQTGWYAQAVYQFMPQWRLGVRYDQVNGNRQSGLLAASTLDSGGTTPRRASAMLEYNTSEFGRFRLQYNRDWSRGAPDNQAILQYIISIGAHGAHIF